MSYGETTILASSLSSSNLNAYVRGWISPDGHGKLYDPTLGGTVTAASANLPSIKEIIAQPTPEYQNVVPGMTYPAAYSDSGAVGDAVGPIHLLLSPSANDTVNASSVMAPWLDMNALVVLATG